MAGPPLGGGRRPGGGDPLGWPSRPPTRRPPDGARLALWSVESGLRWWRRGAPARGARHGQVPAGDGVRAPHPATLRVPADLHLWALRAGDRGAPRRHAPDPGSALASSPPRRRPRSAIQGPVGGRGDAPHRPHPHQRPRPGRAHAAGSRGDRGGSPRRVDAGAGEVPPDHPLPGRHQLRRHHDPRRAHASGPGPAGDAPAAGPWRAATGRIPEGGRARRTAAAHAAVHGPDPAGADQRGGGPPDRRAHLPPLGPQASARARPS